MMQHMQASNAPAFAGPAPLLPNPSLTAAERLAVLLSYAAYADDERAEVARLAADVDWAELDRLVTHNVIRPQARRQLLAAGQWERVPEALATPWTAHAELIAARNASRLETAAPLFADFAAAGIRVALLKGIYFAPTYYGDAGYKRMNDIDFLVERENVDKLMGIVKAHDYFSLGLIKDDDERQTSFSHHAPPFFHPTLRCVLGTHWGLISPRTGYTPDYDAMWTRVVPFEFLGHAHFGLHPVDNLHHLCIHLPHYKTGLRELADIYNLLRAEEAHFDWPLFEAEVAKAGSADLVYHALSLVYALVPLPGVGACLARLKPQARGFYAHEAKRRTAVPSRILAARSTLTSEIDKCFGEFVTAGDFDTKLRTFVGMWRRGLWAPTEDIARFHYLDPNDPTLRLRSPSMLLRVMRHGAKDFGWPIYLALLIKLDLDLVKAFWRKLRGTEKPNKLLAAARSRGLTTEQIEELRELLE